MATYQGELSRQPGRHALTLHLSAPLEVRLGARDLVETYDFAATRDMMAGHAGEASRERAAGGDGVSYGSERAETLLDALRAITHTSWRWAGASVAVERVSPYRVVVLSGSAWNEWRTWRDDASAPDCDLCVEVHTPLHVASDGVQFSDGT